MEERKVVQKKTIKRKDERMKRAYGEKGVKHAT